MSEEAQSPLPKPRAKRTYHPNEAKPIDKPVFEGLCRIDCTNEEMVAVLGCSMTKIEKWCRATYGAKFDAVSRHFRHEQNARYRKRQDELAMQSKNPEMLKFLGKVRLGQKETATTRDAGPRQNFFQINVGPPPKQLDGPPPPPVRKLVSCGEAKLTEPADEGETPSAASLLRKARETIDGVIDEGP